MNARYLLALACLFAANAQADEAQTMIWDPGCNHTMTTNHFTLAPNEATQRIYIDLSGCTDEQVGSLLFFGYHTTKTRSRGLTTKNKVRLEMSALNSEGIVLANVGSNTGSILVDVNETGTRGCWLVARNIGRKEITIRLRSQLVAP